jgi:hypothetical protein
MQGREGFRRTIRTLKDRTFVTCQNYGESHATFAFQRYYLELVAHGRWDLLKKYICERGDAPPTDRRELYYYNLMLSR